MNRGEIGEIKEIKVLRILGFLVMLILPLPLLITAESAGYSGHRVERLAVWCFISGICALLGFFLAKFTQKIKKLFLKNGLYYAFAIVFSVIATLLIGYGQGTSLSAILFFFCALYYVNAGGRLKREKSPFSPIWLGIYCGAILPIYIAHDSFTEKVYLEAGQNAIIIITFIVLILGVNLLNQREITSLASRRADAAALLPKKLRRFNLTLITIFLSLVFALYLFREPIAFGIKELGRLIAEGMLNILSIISSGTDDYVFDEAELPLSDGGINSMGNILWTIFAAILIAAAAFAFRNQIWDALRSLAEWFRQKLGRRHSSEESNEAYTDYFTFVERKGKKSNNTFRKALKAYKKEKQPEKKYRLGYKAYLIWLSAKGKLIPSHTVDKQLVPAAQLCPDQAAKVTVDYQGVRYGEAGVDNDQITVMDSLLEKIKNVKNISEK